MKRAFARSFLAAMALGATCLEPPALAAEFNDPDWPCVQRKVPALSMGQMWSGAIPQGDWRDAPEISALAARIAPRRSALDEVEAQVAAFAQDLPEAERDAALALLFSGVLDLIDAERGQLIEGIGRYAHNQTALSTRVEEMQTELVALNAAEDRNLDRIEELEDTLGWEERIFRDRAQALTYVCETPVLLEQRAFAIARIIAAQL